jgi:hypothetical protein
MPTRTDIERAESAANTAEAIAKLSWAKARLEDDFMSAVTVYHLELLRYLYESAGGASRCLTSPVPASSD